MTLVIDDGGRAAAGYKGMAGDCVTRAIAIAAGLPYASVYDELFGAIKERYGTARQRGPECRRIKYRADGTVQTDRARRKRLRARSPRNGVSTPIIRKYLTTLGWEWTPTMFIGSGCKVHLRAEELPHGRLIVSCSGHITAVIDGDIHDTYDPSRGGTRCVYGYWRKA